SSPEWSAGVRARAYEVERGAAGGVACAPHTRRIAAARFVGADRARRAQHRLVRAGVAGRAAAAVGTQLHRLRGDLPDHRAAPWRSVWDGPVAERSAARPARRLRDAGARA